jgi:hypothetical protein
VVRGAGQLPRAGDEASPDIRAAQKSLWEAGLALEGPDSDALKGQLRERNGQGVHFSGQGLREHAARWVEKVAPWLETQSDAVAPSPLESSQRHQTPRVREGRLSKNFAWNEVYISLAEPSS